MADAYIQPRQARAKNTEQKFLDALNELLQHKSLNALTIDEIAAHAKLTRSAFLKRFGTKKQALILLYEAYCHRVLASIAEIGHNMPTYADVMAVAYAISTQAEKLQIADFSANRAMHELYMEELAAAPQTKMLFIECVALMKKIQQEKMTTCPTATDVGAFSAAQLIFTINHNHVLKAMPGLPRDFHTRHTLIARMVSEALKF